jgi:nucleoside-diphosphate-sugar epimerase
VNLVICTFSGNEQLNLINAAAQNGVQFFVPSEFEGSIDKRPENDELDPYSYSHQARQLLRRWARSSQMKCTVFSCGIFMERFLPSGLGDIMIGYGSNLAMPGSYLLDTSSYTAEYVERNARGHTVRVCMTSVYDVAQFVVAAIDLGPANWPREFTMRGDRLSVRDVVGQCSRALNGNPRKLLTIYPKLTSQPLFSSPSGRPQTLLDLLLHSTNRAIMQKPCFINSFKQLSKEDMISVRRL